MPITFAVALLTLSAALVLFVISMIYVAMFSSSTSVRAWRFAVAMWILDALLALAAFSAFIIGVTQRILGVTS